MARPAHTRNPPDGDLTYRHLVERVVQGDEQAWKEFVERFSNLLFSLLWRYANGDQDRCADLYLYVIEGLHQSNEDGETFYRLRRYLESVDRFKGKGRLTTWLGRVTQNLVSDYFREQEGRRTLPRAIQRMDLEHQITFKLLYWDCLTEREAHETLKSRLGTLARERFDRMIVEINRALRDCNRWSIYTEVMRRTPALPLHPAPADRTESSEIQVADGSTEANPPASSRARQRRESVRSMGELLRRVIAALPEESRLLLVCRFKHGMTAGKIARLLGRTDEKKIYTELDRLKTSLKQEFEREGCSWDQIAGGLEAIEGLMDEFDRQGKGWNS